MVFIVGGGGYLIVCWLDTKHIFSIIGYQAYVTFCGVSFKSKPKVVSCIKICSTLRTNQKV